MSLVCSLSGEVPEEPVYCVRTGYIYEKRLIRKHIQANGVCPITHISLTLDDLTPIKKNSTIAPRPITASSIPGLLSCLQNEWDALVSETFVLKTHLEQCRKQLSHALYQQDAATRVIARLIRERDHARQQMQQQQLLMLQQAANAPEEEEELGIGDALQEDIKNLAGQLLATRKKRNVPPIFVSSSVASSLQATSALPLHSATTKGVLKVKVDTLLPRLQSLAEDKSSDPRSQVISVSAGMDGAVVFFDIQRKKQLEKIACHQKACRDVVTLPQHPIFVTASDDKTCKIWKGSEDFSSPYTSVGVMKKQQGAVTSLSLHPLGTYVAAAAADRTWSFMDVTAAKYLHIAKNTHCQYTCLSFHPDGMILGCGGSDGKLYIWDLKSQGYKASLPGHTGKINELAFSENGYYLATASSDGTVKLWDLRKSLSFQTIPMSDAVVAGGTDVPAAHSVKFDYSGSYVACGGANNAIKLYNFETRANAVPVVTLSEHSGSVMDVQFVEGMNMMLSASMDKTVRVWEPTDGEEK